MLSGTAYNDTCHPGHREADFAATLSALSWMPVSICWVRAARGATCLAPFRRGKPCTTIASNLEQTFGWLSGNRRMSNDYERKVRTSATVIAVARIRRIVARLGRLAYRDDRHVVRDGTRIRRLPCRRPSRHERSQRVPPQALGFVRAQDAAILQGSEPLAERVKLDGRLELAACAELARSL